MKYNILYLILIYYRDIKVGKCKKNCAGSVKMLKAISLQVLTFNRCFND